MAIATTFILPMSFPQRLIALRKERGFTQQQMADKIGMHVSQLKRYETATSQPTIEVFRRIALALNVSADMLLFDAKPDILPGGNGLAFDWRKIISTLEGTN